MELLIEYRIEEKNHIQNVLFYNKNIIVKNYTIILHENSLKIYRHKINF